MNKKKVMEFETVDKVAFASAYANLIDEIAHKKYADFALVSCADGSYWVIEIDEHVCYNRVERLPDNVDAEKWFAEEFSGNLVEDVKALWAKQKKAEQQNFTKIALSATHTEISKQIQWITENENIVQEDYQQHFLDTLKEKLNAINESILRNIQAA